MINVIEETSNVGVQYKVDSRAVNPLAEFC